MGPLRLVGGYASLEMVELPGLVSTSSWKFLAEQWGQDYQL